MANTISLIEYISKCKNGRFVIPDYQRGYVWGQYKPKQEKDSVTFLIENLIEAYKVYVESNGAIICLRWWSAKPMISIMRTEEEKARLSENNKFGDVIPLSSYKAFQEEILNILPSLRPYAKADSANNLQFNTLNNVATFYLMLDKIDENKELLSRTVQHSPR